MNGMNADKSLLETPVAGRLALLVLMLVLLAYFIILILTREQFPALMLALLAGLGFIAVALLLRGLRSLSPNGVHRNTREDK